jgi:hypothetical protein
MIHYAKPFDRQEPGFCRVGMCPKQLHPGNSLELARSRFLAVAGPGSMFVFNLVWPKA